MNIFFFQYGLIQQRYFFPLLILLILFGHDMRSQYEGARPYIIDENRSVGHKMLREFIDSLRRHDLLHSNGIQEKSDPPASITTESFGGGLEGYWQLNKCTDNQNSDGIFGHKTDLVQYNSLLNKVYAVSHGRLLLKGDLVNEGVLEIQNHQTKIYGKALLCLVEDDSTSVLIGGVNSSGTESSLAYSIDEGLTWSIATGGNFHYHEFIWGGILNDNSKTILALVKRVAGNSFPPNFEHILLLSKDKGKSYHEVKIWSDLTTESVLGCLPYGSDSCYFLSKEKGTAKIETFKFSTANSALTLIDSTNIQSGSVGGKLVGTHSNGIDHLYFNVDNTGYHFDGFSWSLAGQHEKWSGLIDINPVDFKHLIYHNFDLKYSLDGGVTYETHSWGVNTYGFDPRVTNWFKKKDSTWVLLFGNDFGVHFTSDFMNKEGWKHVNRSSVHQILHHGNYSDKRELLVTSNQDRGTLVWKEDSAGFQSGEMVQSADGLRSCIASTGNSYWFIHYWGEIYHAFHPDDRNHQLKKYKVSNDSWYTPPMAQSTVPGEDAIYFTGYDSLIKCIYNKELEDVEVVKQPFNFRTASGGKPYGIATVEADSNRIYVCTDNGKFYASRDQGKTWNNTTYTGSFPSYAGNYFGSSGYAIAVSPHDPDFVCVAGYGTSANAFIISRDGGETFSVATEGMTRFHNREIVITPNGKYVFGTNQMVFVVDENKWYDLRGTSCPVDEFTSGVDYIPSKHVVRFYSYGVGVLDLILQGTSEVPIVRISNIINNDVWPVGKNLIKVDAYDGDGIIDTVFLFQNGKKVGFSTDFPYQFKIEVSSIGNHFFQAGAIDNSGFYSTSSEVNIEVIDVVSLKPEVPGCVNQKLKYDFYSGNGSLVSSNLDMLIPTLSGLIDSFDIGSSYHSEDYFAQSFKGYLQIVQSGIYEFSPLTGGNMVLYLAGDTIGYCTPPLITSSCAKSSFYLEKGYYPIRVDFWKGNWSSNLLEINYRLSGEIQQEVPAKHLFHEANSNCLDCYGTPDGTAEIDSCGNCVLGFTGIDPCVINGVDFNKHLESLVLRPNPATNRLIIEYSEKMSGHQLRIINAQGKVKFQDYLTGDQQNVFTLDISGLKNGIYFIQVGVTARKLIVIE